MLGEIITIGDELITGRVCDLNSFFLSGRISSYGLNIQALVSVGDNEDRILEALAQAVQRSDFVIVSGGLGPTEDDITVRVAARFFNRSLRVDEQFLEQIRQSLQSRGLPWFDSYRKMALLPEGAQLIDPNEACGFYYHQGRTPIVFLPGVPREVRLLAEAKVIPLLLASRGQETFIRQRIFKFFGPPEAQIGEVLHDLAAGDGRVQVGFYPNFPENHVTVTVRAESDELAGQSLTRLEAEVERLLGSWLVAKDAGSLEESVGRVLRERGLTVAVAESCTGGLISHRFTSVSGSSNYFDRGLVVYSNRAKMELLKVPAEVLDVHGAVSEETAIHMARGVRELSGVDLGLASTGIAGPTGGTKEKPVGTVYLALAGPNGVGARRLSLNGSREQITILTAETALSWLYQYLADDKVLHSG